MSLLSHREGGRAMEELEELRRHLNEDRPVSWETLPDISLYMDQLIGYMPRQLIHAGGAEGLTSAMVNNYIKDGLLPRAEGKRYSREHLAYLTEICALKQILPVREAGVLAKCREGESVRDHYEHFRSRLDAALSETAHALEGEAGELEELALELALRSYADKLACRRILALLDAGRESEEKKTKKNRKEK